MSSESAIKKISLYLTSRSDIIQDQNKTRFHSSQPKGSSGFGLHEHTHTTYFPKEVSSLERACKASELVHSWK